MIVIGLSDHKSMKKYLFNYLRILNTNIQSGVGMNWNLVGTQYPSVPIIFSGRYPVSIGTRKFFWLVPSTRRYQHLSSGRVPLMPTPVHNNKVVYYSLLSVLSVKNYQRWWSTVVEPSALIGWECQANRKRRYESNRPRGSFWAIRLILIREMYWYKIYLF